MKTHCHLFNLHVMHNESQSHMHRPRFVGKMTIHYHLLNTIVTNDPIQSPFLFNDCGLIVVNGFDVSANK